MAAYLAQVDLARSLRSERTVIDRRCMKALNKNKCLPTRCSMQRRPARICNLTGLRALVFALLLFGSSWAASVGSAQAAPEPWNYWERNDATSTLTIDHSIWTVF